MKIDWIKIGFGLVILFLSVLAIIYGVNQMINKNATKVAFYGLILLLIAKEMAWSLRSIIDGINKDASSTESVKENKQ